MLNVNEQNFPQFVGTHNNVKTFAVKVNRIEGSTVYSADGAIKPFEIDARTLGNNIDYQGWYCLISAEGVERFISSAIFQQLYKPVLHPIGLPVYQSHKQVRAAMITGITEPANETDNPLYFLHLADPMIAAVQVTPEWFKNRRPAVGGYFVEYEDGYRSYSPAKAFEDGYTKLDLAA